MNPAILTLDEAILRFGRKKRNGRIIVFAHGCFDLLHPGHIRSLERSRELGDALLVGLYGDAVVRQWKGESRPVLPERERAEILAALECVDAVVLLENVAPQEAITRLLPDVLLNPADGFGGKIACQEKVEAAGGHVVSVPVVPGYSTGAILRKILEGARASRAES